MPLSPERLKPGETVRIRGERWRIARSVPFGDSSLIEAAGLDRTNRGGIARFLLPFEPIERLASQAAPRVVRPARWRHIARQALRDATPSWHALRTVAAAAIDIVPFQLEPALALLSGRGCRALIADDVGLGKTVQAGIIVAELLAREPDARIVIVSPAGLREQWRAEMHERFRLEAAVLDAAGVAHRCSSLGPGISPWATHPLIVTSIDYLKRPEVIRSLEPLVWDLAIFDEAHGLAGRSDRAAAANLLAARARRVVLLTATPHSGDDDAFRRMCELGQLPADGPLLVFRRTRADAGIGTARHTTLLKVRPTPAERLMHDALLGYAQRVWTSGDAGGRLAISVLVRRACSSAAALARSLERRLTLLAANGQTAAQLTLPFLDPSDDDQEPSAGLAAPGLADAGEERSLLERLLTLAADAARSESKIAALTRLLRRARQPMLVFTEYRDTLTQLASQLPGEAVQLHGGMTLAERRDAARAFTSGHADLLLATDAASEGLNLHHRCRLTVTLELPWSPTRLEQRVGRIDRIGQRRTVHAVHLVAAGTGEELIVARLAVRAQCARSALQDIAIAHLTDQQVAEGIVLATPVPPATAAAAWPLAATTVDLRDEAGAEARRLSALRAVTTGCALENSQRPALTIIRRTKERRTPSAYWLWRIAILDANGRSLWDLPVALDAAVRRLRSTAAESRAALACPTAFRAALDAEEQRRLAELIATLPRLVAGLEQRERGIIATLEAERGRLAATLVQQGLFDRRREHAALTQDALILDAVERTRARLAELDAWRRPSIGHRTLVVAVALQ